MEKKEKRKFIKVRVPLIRFLRPKEAFFLRFPNFSRKWHRQFGQARFICFSFFSRLVVARHANRPTLAPFVSDIFLVELEDERAAQTFGPTIVEILIFFQNAKVHVHKLITAGPSPFRQN